MHGVQSPAGILCRINQCWFCNALLLSRFWCLVLSPSPILLLLLACTSSCRLSGMLPCLVWKQSCSWWLKKNKTYRECYQYFLFSFGLVLLYSNHIPVSFIISITLIPFRLPHGHRSTPLTQPHTARSPTHSLTHSPRHLHFPLTSITQYVDPLHTPCSITLKRGRVQEP